MTTAPQFETLTELKLTDELKELINQAYVPNDWPIVMAYITPENTPRMSYRGSTIAFSDTALAIWARSAEAGVVQAVNHNPNVVLMYRQPTPGGGRSRAVITFRGRGRVAADEAERRRVYDTMPQVERDADKEYAGVAIIINLDAVDGFFPGYRLQMRR
jgi:hypothetical protein